MKAQAIFPAGLLALLLVSAAGAQSVYRCEEPDGSIVFSDLPCRSDSGRQSVVDATPHQGHRPSPAGAMRAFVQQEEAGSSRPQSGRSGASRETTQDRLSRSERLSLEGERRQLLSGLKRRHIAPSERRALIRELREVDRRLGIGPGEVDDMPFHNREIYEDYPVFPDD